MENKIITAEDQETRPALTAEEEARVAEYKSKIDISNKSYVIQYGAASQNRMVSFSETVLTQVRNKDMGGVGELLSGLLTNLKTFDRTMNSKGLFSIFMSLKKKLIHLKSQYSKVETNVVQVERQLEKHYQTLLKDIHLFDQLYKQNEGYCRDLSLYIYAGEDKIQELRSKELSNEETQQLHYFEKKLHDLKISRMISLQMAPQIRMIQNNSAMLMDKIQSSIVNTLPLWRNQMVLALGLIHSQQALDAQKAVNDATNEMLRRNSDMLRSSTIELARESERSIVDMDTLHKINIDLFATIDEVMSVQEEGRQKRLEAERELQKVELEFRTKIKDLSTL
ncbi:toxic anion resistance protein [Bacteroides sp. 224]|uniref:toxic anion resistance protein n=1 Tax=Bacteroides sp. 224 TaxID=2302936 RepID=UPI0013D087B1|nr:toxic anion resistance protein [Bacteroides sp. 224]NDV65587.1 toxic anion resistance protein [Bacteroides sp. 224]